MTRTQQAQWAALAQMRADLAAIVALLAKGPA